MALLKQTWEWLMQMRRVHLYRLKIQRLRCAAIHTDIADADRRATLTMAADALVEKGRRDGTL